MAATDDQQHALEDLSRYVVGDAPLDELMARIAETAKHVIPPVVEASVTFTNPSDGAWTAASTGEVAIRLDEAQYGLGHGPCLDAASGGTPVLIADMASEDRWPDYAPLAVEAGIASSLSTPVPIQEQIVAALNLYAREPGAFDDDDLELADAIAARAAVAIANALRYESATQLAHDLQEAMASRAMIEQAKGIIMATTSCGPEAAFDVLVRASQRENRKLRDVARDLVARHTPPA